tara:strand:- start:446 stop:745 length:300 start_codon:yes stop_codon:yes gene_type:complete
MKETILIVFLTLLSSCSLNKFGSYTEAQIACFRWKNNGIEYKVRSKPGISGTQSFRSRYCQYDKETRQFLGWEYQKVEANKIYKERPFFDKKVTKRFYF